LFSKKVKKIILFIDSEPSSGGVFQYNQSILEATLALPRDKYELVVMYTSKVWEPYLKICDKKIKIRFGNLDKRIIQSLIMADVPLNLLRFFLNLFHPVARKIIDQSPDLCIFPSQESFWGYVTKVPSIVTIHDLMHRYEKQFREVSGFWRFRHKEMHFKNICKYVKGILVDSELGKRHVHESYFFLLNRIFVLPYKTPKYIYEQDISPDFDLKYSLPLKYIFYPAQFWQHKNHVRLIKAVHSLRKELPDIHLVLVGSKKNGYESVARSVKDLNLEGIVHFMGFVPERDLAEFYKRAVAMIMPTFFGPTNIPPLEAFSSGCAVGVSNIYGMPDQVRDAALLFNPMSVEEISSVIKKLWTDDTLRLRLIEKGRSLVQGWGTVQFNKRFRDILEELCLQK
jgi:glycosyltransferase involved in cell wall biosynthesis